MWYIRISYLFTSDFQFITNKCSNNYYIYNEENPTEFYIAINIKFIF